MRKTNYHSHTEWCKHATGTIEELVLEAISKNFDVLGISPHIPTPGDHMFRMKVSEFPHFYEEFQRVKFKYKNQIELRLGLETEYFPHHFDYYDTFYENYTIDYTILGHHFRPNETDWYGLTDTKEMLDEYVESLIAAMETGRYDFVAHPDVFGLTYPFEDDSVSDAARKIFAAAGRLSIPVEFNANGMRQGKVKKPFGMHYAYPWEFFWKEAKDDQLKVLVNSDNHQVDDLCDSAFLEALKTAQEYGLNLVDDYRGNDE